MKAAAVSGALSGVAATGAMSMLMAAWRWSLGGGPFGPTVVTDRTLAPAGVLPDTAPARATVRMAAHVAFGSGVGALYAVATPTVLRAVPGVRAVPAPARGAAYGLGVWGVTYGSALPALLRLPPPSRDRRGRQPRLVVAHLVYGAVLGALCPIGSRTGGPTWS